MSVMRLDKMLSSMGIGTRNEIRKACRDNRIMVNGTIIRDPSVHIDPDKDIVILDEEPVLFTRYVYFMLNKPAGTISATSDSRTTVLDLIDCSVKGLYPVGRLDLDTEGLLLITNDGPLGHQLLSPKNHVEKEYLVQLKTEIEDGDLEPIRKGIRLNKDETCLPAEVRITGERECRIILQEGKFHEIKRMFSAIGNEVVYLKRLRMKDLVLDESLAPGEYRELSEAEIAGLKESAH